MTEMGLDIQAIEHLDFEFAPPCENAAQECDRTAAWKFTLACCGGIILLCEPCKVEEMELVHKYPYLVQNCAICKRESTLGEHIFSLERL